MRNITKPHRGNYVKHLLVTTATTIPVLLIFIFFSVVPFGKEYKGVKKEAKLLERDLQVVELKHKHRFKELYNLELEHKQIMHKFKEPQSTDSFKSDNPYVYKIVELKEKREENELFEKLVYKIETQKIYSTLDNMYDLMKNSEDFNMKYVIDFPIIFEVEKRGRLKASFNLNIQKLKPIKKEIVRPYTDIQ